MVQISYCSYRALDFSNSGIEKLHIKLGGDLGKHILPGAEPNPNPRRFTIHKWGGSIDVLWMFSMYSLSWALLINFNHRLRKNQYIAKIMAIAYNAAIESTELHPLYTKCNQKYPLDCILEARNSQPF